MKYCVQTQQDDFRVPDWFIHGIQHNAQILGHKPAEGSCDMSSLQLLARESVGKLQPVIPTQLK